MKPVKFGKSSDIKKRYAIEKSQQLHYNHDLLRRNKVSNF